MTESPKSIEEVSLPIGETSAMPLIITLPGKLPNTHVLQITHQIIVNVIQCQLMQLMTNRN